jgi:cytochrome P450
MSTHSESVTYPFNLPESLEPGPGYADARDAPGLIRVRLPFGEPAWLATRYADVRLVLGDRRFGRAPSVEADEPRWSEAKVGSGMLAMDPPEHTRLRALVAKAFTQRRMERLRPRIRELASRLVDELLAMGPPVDLVENFAIPLPVGVICELLGVPVEDRTRFRVWSDAVLSTNVLTESEFEANRAEFRAYISGLIERRRAEPADDLMTELIEARDERDRLSELELVDLCLGILLAGHETTATQLPNFVYVLLEDPQRWAQLRADPALLPAAVEELMRFVPLGMGASFPRYAMEDVEVGGVLVRAGEPVLITVGSANRDPRQFDAPDELRFDRKENQHLGFGHGAHHCLGAQLARIELQEGLRILLDRLPSLHLADDITWKTQTLLRGPETMPIAW